MSIHTLTNAAVTLATVAPMMKLFLVSMTWHEWPNQGAHIDTVGAVDPAEAEEKIRQEMAILYIKNNPQYIELQDEDGKITEETLELVMDSFKDEWHLVNCLDVYGFIEAHTGG